MRGEIRRSRPRIGFLGVGWIGQNRLEALARSGHVEIVGVVDPSDQNARTASQAAAGCPVLGSFEELLDLEPDGVVIATPSALHASQSIAALERGASVFCQKPLARTAGETAEVVNVARAVDRLLAVDLSYRFVTGAQRIRELIQAGELGTIYAVDLVFHNAYGPDKSWFFNPALSGGGCVIDLGIHLVDLALWSLAQDRVIRVSSRLFAAGEPLGEQSDAVETYAAAQLDLASGAVVRLACSWNLPAGQDAIIEVGFFGTAGGAMLSNVNGSFYDFVANRFRGTSRERLSDPSQSWGGGAALAWAATLAENAAFDPKAEALVELAAVLDAIYGRNPPQPDIGVERLAGRMAGLAVGR